MYGKQFIAGLMFLAVAHVRAQDDDEEEVDVEEEGADEELYEVSPEPDIYNAPEDAGIEVEIPEGDWTVTELGFALLAVDEEDEAVAEWAEGLPEELAAYAPTDYVLCGVAAVESLDDENGYALGAQGESQSKGILAVSWAGEQFTVYFDSEADYEEEGALAETIDPELANSEEGFEDNSGVGDVWGQSFDEFWHIWSYNGEDGSESWEEGALSILYVEYDVDTEEFSSFTSEIDLVAAGAASLVAFATTASLLLAMM